MPSIALIIVPPPGSPASPVFPGHPPLSTCGRTKTIGPGCYLDLCATSRSGRTSAKANLSWLAASGVTETL
jgi:hypothetical protein